MSKRVAVLMGGISAEREVSLVSGRECAKALSEAGYEVTVRPDTLTLDVSGQTCAILAGMEGSAQIISREETVLRFVLRKARLVTNIGAS